MTFAADLARFAKRTNQSIDKVVYAVTFEWFASVVLASPVGDPSNWKFPERAPAGYVGGRFRGNWRASVGSPETEALAQIRAQPEVLSEISSTIPAAAGSVVYLANNLPYAARIEYEGWSGQAKRGVVRVNFTRVQGLFRKAVRENKVDRKSVV